MQVGAALCLGSGPALSQNNQPGSKGLLIAQIVDMSVAHRDVSKDFLIGARAAWQEFSRHAPPHVRDVEHLVLEVDGSTESLRAALARAHGNPACVALFGTVAGAAASKLTVLMRSSALVMAHVAPWLLSADAVDDHTFPIFAPRADQIAHALNSLSLVGVRELAVVYATPADHVLNHDAVQKVAASLQLRVTPLEGNQSLEEMGQHVRPSAPVIMLFLGGTPELSQFIRGLERQSRPRYVVGLADVNLQILMQMGRSRRTATIATQAVPLVSSSAPVVRAYRDALSRLFDEPPSPLSLAGYIAARYTQEVLARVDGKLTRANILATFQRREDLDLGGFRIHYTPQKYGSTYVTQSMLTSEGRIVG